MRKKKEKEKETKCASGLEYNASHLTKSGTLFHVCQFKAYYYNAKTYAIMGDAGHRLCATQSAMLDHV